MFKYATRLARTDPEGKLKQAQSALEGARAKYETALDHAHVEADRHAADINSLTAVITTKQERVTALDTLASSINDTWSVISGIIGNA